MRGNIVTSLLALCFLTWASLGPLFALEPMDSQSMSNVSGQAGIQVNMDAAIQSDQMDMEFGSGTLRISDIFYGEVGGNIGNRSVGQFNNLQVRINNGNGLEFDLGSTPAGDRLGFEIRDLYLGDPGGNSLGSFRIGGFEVGQTDIDIRGLNQGAEFVGQLDGTIDSIDWEANQGASCSGCSGNAGVLHLGQPGDGIVISDGGGGSIGLGSGLSFHADDQAGLVFSYPDIDVTYEIRQISIGSGITNFGNSFGQLELGGVTANNTFIEMRGNGGGLIGAVSAGITGDYMEFRDPNGASDGSGNGGVIRLGGTSGSDAFVYDRDGNAGGDSSRFTGLTLTFDNSVTIGGTARGGMIFTVPDGAGQGCTGNACPDIGINNIYLGSAPDGNGATAHSVGRFDAENISLDGTTVEVGAQTP